MTDGIGRRRAASMRREAYVKALGRNEKTVADGHLATCDVARKPYAHCTCGRAEWAK